MKAIFNTILPYFSLNISLRSWYCNYNWSNMLFHSSVIQIIKFYSHLWVNNWKPHIGIFPGGHLAFRQHGRLRWKATTAALLYPIFWLQGHIPNQNSLWDFFKIPRWYRPTPWASYQIRKIAGCACAGNAGNVFPRRRFQRKPLVSDSGMHHGTCVTHVPWCMSGSLTCGDGENVPGIPGACAPVILRIW